MGWSLAPKIGQAMTYALLLYTRGGNKFHGVGTLPAYGIGKLGLDTLRLHLLTRAGATRKNHRLASLQPDLHANGDSCALICDLPRLPARWSQSSAEECQLAC